MITYIEDEDPDTRPGAVVTFKEEFVNDVPYIEKESLLLALRNTVAPSLNGADAVVFATLISDLFPSHDIPLIFDQSFPESIEQSFSRDTIGVSMEKADGSPLHSLPGSPQPQDQGIARFLNILKICISHSTLGRNFHIFDVLSSTALVSDMITCNLENQVCPSWTCA